MTKPALFIILILTFLQACRVSNRKIGEVTATEKGKVAGIFDKESRVYAFKGIPFARAPVDTLRWKPPQPAEGWEDTLDVTEFGPICMQPEPRPFLMWTREFIAPAGNMSEDCLNLNVWTREGDADAQRPVIVFIHGGGFNSGSGSVPLYDGTNMAGKGVVFVTINYRVGILGFMAHPGLTEESPAKASGNYGLLDQIAALEWVQNNIANFGGDPENVTIAGQSAGSFSVNYLVASPRAKGLFHRAIAESGAAFLPSNRILMDNSLETAEGRGRKVAESMGTETVGELRDIPADSLLGVQALFAPIVDGHVLPEPVYDLFKTGDYNNVPVLTGWNADEGNFMGPSQDAEAFRQSTEERFGEYSDEVLNLFPAGDDSVAWASQRALGSLMTFGLQSWAWMKLQNETGESPVYMYYFTRKLPFTKDQRDYGAFHTGEVPYAYYTLHQSDRPWEPVDYELAETMSSYWVNFAANGDPNGNGMPDWSPSRPEEYEAMIFGTAVEPGRVPSIERLRLLEKIFTEQMNQQEEQMTNGNR